MIIYENSVIDFLDDLVFKLYKDEYFGFLDSSNDFVAKIVAFIDDNIEVFPSRKSPFELLYLGSNYIFYKSNQRTTWYIFFENLDDNYLITSIINSNSEEVKWL